MIDSRTTAASALDQKTVSLGPVRSPRFVMGIALTLIEHAAQEARRRRPHRALFLGGVVERAARISPPGVSSLGHSSHIFAIQVEDLGNLFAHLCHRGPAARGVQGQAGRPEVRCGRAASDRDRAGLRVGVDTGG